MPMVNMVILKLPQPSRHALDDKIFMIMKGNEVFKIAVTQLSHVVTETLRLNNIEKTEIKANYRIIAATAKKLSMSMDKVVVTLTKHGNTSAALCH